MSGDLTDVRTLTTCPSCGSPVGAGERFCENCGADLPGDGAPAEGGGDGAAAGSVPTVSAHAAHGAPAVPGPVRPGVVVPDVDLTLVPTTCEACGGHVAPDGYCEECGTPARRPRDHWLEQPAPWVAMVCDRGVRHTRNEDAGAVAATSEPGGFAVLVVCDGVSSAVDSDRASLAAVRAARAVLVAQPAAPSNPADAVTDDEDARRAVLEDAVRRSAAAADREAVEAAVDPREPNPPSCTFVVAVVEGPLLVAGWVGDSRAYWLPDDGPPEQLSVDDSWASEAMAHGMTREEAESGPHAHAITRWLGVDAPDPVPRTTARRLDRAGWVLVCSDGLWNYASAADDVQRLLVDVLDGTVTAADPARVSEELVAWANRQGGQDNVTVALARVAVEAPEPE